MTGVDNNQVTFNPHDYDGMIKLMDRHEEFTSMLIGENEDGERVTISINRDNITTMTDQKNGWIRENIYYRDRDTEELFHRRGKEV